MTEIRNSAPNLDAGDDLFAPPSYPDIQDVHEDTVTGSDGAPQTTGDTIAAPAPVAVEQSSLAPLAAAPAATPQTPTVTQDGQAQVPATAPAETPSAPVQTPPEGQQQAPAPAPEASPVASATATPQDAPPEPARRPFSFTNAQGQSFVSRQVIRPGVNMDNLQPGIRGVVQSVSAAGIVPEFEITSGYRDPSHNSSVGGAQGSRHIRGEAVDISTRGWTDDQRRRFVAQAIASGARGIGIYPNGSIHLDTRETPAIWGPHGYSGSSVSTFPAWAQPELNKLVASGGPGVLRAPQFVVAAATTASRLTGVSSSYLVSLARKESNFDPNAAAPTSSARGMFQFLTQDTADSPSTWTAMLREYGPQYGIAANTPATDPQAAAIMAAALAKKNEAHLTAAFPGRTITDGDRYLAHFAGAEGAIRFLRGIAENPNQPATALFGREQVEANRRIFFDGQRPRTAAEVQAKLTEGFGGGTVAVDPNARRDPTAPVYAADVAAPPPVLLGRQYEAGYLASIRAHQGEQQKPFLDLLGDALRTETILGQIMNSSAVPKPDPNYSIGPFLKDLTAGLPEQFHDRFRYAVSADHAQAIRAQALRDAQAVADRERAGWTGTGAQVLAGFLDPVALSAGVASGGLASGAAGLLRLGRAGSIALQAGAGAASNVALDIGSGEITGNHHTPQQLLFSGLTGAAFGAAFGPLGRNPATEDIAAQVLQVTQAGRQRLLQGASPEALEAGAGRPASVGAAANDALGMPPVLNDAAFRAVQDKDVPRGSGRGWLDGLRFSSGGQIATSPNPITRLFGGALAVDNVGKGVHTNNRSADQRVQMLTDRWDARWHQTLVPAYEEWAEARGIGAAMRKMGAGLEEFGTEVGLAVRQTDRALFDALPEPIRRTALEFRSQMNERRLDLQDPRRHSGGGGRPIPGSEFLNEDPSYFTRIWVDAKIQAAVRRFGYRNVESVVAGAIRRAQPTVEDDMAERLAGTLLRSPSNRDVNLDDRLSRALSSGDADLLRSALSETKHWEAAEIEAVVGQLSRGRTTGRDANLKRRVDLDETHFVDDLRTTDGGRGMLRVSDLLEDNAIIVMASYNRKIAGRVALAEQRIVNPSNGEVLMDGIVGDADLETIIRRMKQAGLDAGQDAASIKLDEANLRWVHDRILGRPDPAVEKLGNVARWMSALRAFNHSRLMGMLGLSQIADVGRAAAGTGIMAFAQHMGGFRRMITMDGRAVLKHGLDRELEAMYGAGTDALRGFTRQLMEDEAMAAAGRGGRLEAVERGARTMAALTNSLSGFNSINSWGVLATGRAAAQRFADMAAKGRLSASERRLLNFLGLDDKLAVTRSIAGKDVTDTELGHVLRSVRAHFSTDEGALFGRKLTALNLDQWADQEARAAFEYALYRMARSTWQEGDIGALHRVMSHPVAQLLFQFRRFSLVAWENQLLHGVANFDGRQAAMFGATLLSGALVYVVQMHLQALGRSDARAFLDSKGFGLRTTEDYQKVGFASLQRAGFSSLVPMAVDTILLGTPIGPQFGARSSGQPSDIFLGNATFGLASDVTRASKGVLGAFYRGEDMSQSDMRNVFRLLSLQNTMPIMQGLSVMIRGREEPQHRGAQ